MKIVHWRRIPVGHPYIRPLIHNVKAQTIIEHIHPDTGIVSALKCMNKLLNKVLRIDTCA